MSNIYVTRPFLPPLDEFFPMLERIWGSAVLTNAGPFHQQFEREVASHLGVENLSLVSNGTIALSLAIEALGLEGEVITTPFSFVATSHSLLLAGLQPRFVDIRESDFNIDPDAVEPVISDQTSAILAVHCYGRPCDTGKLSEIASDHDLRVIYDAAHAFGVQLGGRSILRDGDVSTLSFHATKAFNTFEGGAIISSEPALKDKMDSLRNFGIRSETEVNGLGSNGKLSEFNSALGLLQLKYFEHVRTLRQERDRVYRELLSGIDGIDVVGYNADLNPNYSYFPVLIRPHFPISRDDVYDGLKEIGVFSRRYFFPLISSFEMYRDLPSADPAMLPVATRVAEQVLCLPIYPDLPGTEQARIVEHICLLAGQSRSPRKAAL